MRLTEMSVRRNHSDLKNCSICSNMSTRTRRNIRERDTEEKREGKKEEKGEKARGRREERAAEMSVKSTDMRVKDTDTARRRLDPKD